MQWPWKRFEAMYRAHTRRIAVEQATDLRNAMISGLWSNSNLDDGKDSRSQALREIEDNYQRTLLEIYSDAKPVVEDKTLDHPLFTAMQPIMPTG